MWFLGKRKPTQRLAERPQSPTFEARLAPDEPLAIIGDVHGCDEALALLLDEIAKKAPDARLVSVGDIVDRGQDSRKVIERLHALSKTGDITTIMGNHEVMLLEFLRDPGQHGARWLRHGGLQTLGSFDVDAPVGMSPAPELLIRARDEFKDVLGGEAIAWLENLPNRFKSGNVAVVHAGADPRLPFDLQDPVNLMWGHPMFSRVDRSDGVWVVHGHTVMSQVERRSGRIGVDTGAYATGRLSAAILRPDDSMEVVEALDEGMR